MANMSGFSLLSYLVAAGFAFLAAICFIVAYAAGIGSIKKGKACTGKTTGTVIGASHVYSNDIPLPKVEYVVGDDVYCIAGPKFAASTVRTYGIGGKSKTNLTVDGDLPATVHMAGDMRETVNVMAQRYPAGKEVDVYYDPKKPKRAYVERYAPAPLVWSLYLPAALGIILAAVAVLLVVWNPFGFQ